MVEIVNLWDSFQMKQENLTLLLLPTIKRNNFAHIIGVTPHKLT